LRLPEGRLSTRKGQVIFLEEVLDQVVLEAQRIIAEKNPELPNADQIAEQVGIGAVIFDDLKRERIRDVTFDIAEVLSFEGETGPYVQYTHARLASILRKASEAGSGSAEADLSRLEDAGTIMTRLARFRDSVRSAAQKAEPSEISTWLLGLCRELNRWYAKNRVLGSEPALEAARLRLIAASKSVIANGLQLLGVAAPEEM
jgi:arginyl-tRNA synthetase